MKTTTTKTVKNLRSSNGNEAPNQFVITTNEGKTFQSYQSVIAFIDNDGKVKLDAKFWDYSATTGKYRNIFLGEDKKVTQKKIDSGEYELTNLNS